MTPCLRPDDPRPSEDEYPGPNVHSRKCVNANYERKVKFCVCDHAPEPAAEPPEWSIVDEERAKRTSYAEIMGPHTRIIVDCREDFGDAWQLAQWILNVVQPTRRAPTPTPKRAPADGLPPCGPPCDNPKHRAPDPVAAPAKEDWKAGCPPLTTGISGMKAEQTCEWCAAGWPRWHQTVGGRFALWHVREGAPMMHRLCQFQISGTRAAPPATIETPKENA